MPFGSFFKKIFKKTAKDVAEKYVGEDAAAAVDGIVDEGFKQLNIDETIDAEASTALQSFSGTQQSGLQSLFSVIGGNADGLAAHAQKLGLDPSLVSGILGMIGGGGGSGGDAAAGGAGGFGLGNLVQVASSLTKGSGTGGGGIEGFLSLIGGGGGSAGNSSSILTVLVGLAKSFFNMQMGKNKAMQDWSDAGAKGDKGRDNFDNWGNNVVKDLVNPGKKDKDTMDDDPSDKPTGGKDDVKGWFDKHPEIGKMQKDVFDDIFDTTDEEGDADRLVDDPTPLVPTPKGFETDCSILDQASILFLNSRILLDLRKEWRFLYSFKTHAKDFSDFYDRIELKGPTLVLIEDTDGNVFGAFTSTSWADTEGGWSGNGDTFIFSIRPKMAVFYSTGKDDNIMYCSRTEGLGLGGRKGRFGLSLDPSLESGSYHEDVDTFDLPAIFPESFSIAHLEVWGLGPATDPDRERAKLHVRKPNLQITDTGGVDMDDLLGQIS